MSIFIIKIIAVITMFLDHIKYAIPETNNMLTFLVGRMSFPLFAFILTEGYFHTSNRKKYVTRLFIFALISQIPFMLFRTLLGEGAWKKLNILFTLLLGMLCIFCSENIKKKYASVPLVVTIFAVGKLLKVDYGWYGISLIYLFYLGRDKKVILLPGMIACATAYYISIFKTNFFQTETYLLILFTLFSLIPIYFYNGKKGRSMKYFFYIFYPLHLIILYGINCFFY